MTRKRSKTHPAASQPRADRTQPPAGKDPFAQRKKLPDPTTCPGCGAIYRDGRWAWGAPPAGAHEAECPACQRIAESYPAGIVTVRGEFARAHRDEITHLVRNLEEREKASHPLKRIMALEEEDDALVVTTTDTHLARNIGDALHHAYQGELDYDPAESETVLRVTWER
jgi:NMD protein affecting ribosome stability and mRNA decay